MKAPFIVRANQGGIAPPGAAHIGNAREDSRIEEEIANAGRLGPWEVLALGIKDVMAILSIYTLIHLFLSALNKTDNRGGMWY